MNGNELNNMQVNLLYAMSFEPKNKKMSINGRTQHTFLYIEQGAFYYKFAKETFTATSGNLVYIPKGATYSFEVVSENTYCWQVEFDITDVNFSYAVVPQIIYNCSDAETVLKRIVLCYGENNQNSYFLAVSSLLYLCSFISEQVSEKAGSESRIKPAVEYIETHYAENFNIDQLAQLCFMSQSQLRRYFSSKYKMSPVTYKNRFRIEKAKSMLLYDVADIGEIAVKLGFDSIYAFSKMFKMYAGITPSQFAKNKNK
ncbi:MAG: helix-turn-helix transcriptional regulator [Clostridia bacterium]|nr:helix-turn-helix transcriptional regulator [Clostridia bacterium]